MDVKEFLGFEFIDRQNLLNLLEDEWGDKLHYKTFQRWCLKLGIKSSKSVYEADEVLDLQIYIWLSKQGGRFICKDEVQNIREVYMSNGKALQC